MDWKNEIRARLEGLNLAPARESEILEELSQHLEDRYRDLVASGLKAEVANAALAADLDESLARELGRVEQRVCLEPVTLGAKGGSVMTDLLRDLRYGFRVLRKNPGFAAVAILSLALGIGVNTALFQMFDAVFLRTLPVQSPQQLAEVKLEPRFISQQTGHFQGRHTELTYAQFEQIRTRQQAFSGVFAWSATRWNLSKAGESRYAQGLWVSGECFDVLGVKALIGRLFSQADDRRGCGTPGAVISYAFWQHEFGGNPSAIGKTINLEGHTVDVIGVTPQDFTGLEVGQSFDVALPICSEPVIEGEDSDLGRLDAWWLDVIGRLKPGWSIKKATAQVASISPSIFQATLPTGYDPDAVSHYLGFKLAAFPAASGLSQLRGDYASPIYLLMALAGLVLLIACANLANLLLARASSREREIAVRLALGASRGRLIRQLLSESVLVAVIGGAAGAILGGILARTLVAFLSTTDNTVFVHLKPDFRLIAFVAGLAVATCLLFGLMPAIRASRNSPASAMQAASRATTASREHLILRRGLVIGQVALSLVLLVGALLFAGNLRKLLTADAGFRQDGILVAHLEFGDSNPPKDQRLQLKRGLLDRVKALAGVDSAADVHVVPLSGNFGNGDVEIDGDPRKTRVHPDFNRVSSGYFATMAIPMLAGRDFASGDTTGSTQVAVVSELFAKKLFNSANPLGARIRVVVGPGEPERIYQIVGLVGDTKYLDIHNDFAPTVYFPESQDPAPGAGVRMVIHSDRALAAVIQGVKQAVADVDPAISLDFQVFRTSVLESLLRERMVATLSGFFGLLAVLLACIGLYGVMSYGVTTRTGEIGVRMALGAERRNVIWMILREALVLVGIGILIGLPAVVAGNRVLESLLYNAKSVDIVVIGLGATALMLVAAFAAYIPARRASRIDPMMALRYE